MQMFLKKLIQVSLATRKVAKSILHLIEVMERKKPLDFFAEEGID